MTVCVQRTMSLTPLGKRAVVADFGGGQITTDGGGLLLREAERVTGIIRGFAACFGTTVHRHGWSIPWRYW